MTVNIYVRDNQGLVKYYGNQGWYDRQQVLDYYCRSNEPVEIEDMLGWPHPHCEWHGDIGFGFD